MIEDLIYDVGMNDGADTAYYLSKGFRVVAIEANPVLAQAASEQFAHEINAGRLCILNIGIAEDEGELPFWICDDHSEWSSFNREIASRDDSKHHQIIIRCRRFSSVLEEFGVPFYLKIDIEGNDYLCLLGLDPRHLPRFISMEAGDPRHFETMKELGFKHFKCISQFGFLPIELPASREQRRYERFHRLLETQNPIVRLLRELGARDWLEKEVTSSRRSGDWIFPWGSSGPFGNELPGRWASYDEIMSTYRQMLDLMANGARSPFWNESDYSFWFDIHARSD